MSEDGYFQIGNVLSPITSSLSNSSLKDVDPVLYYIIKYFAGIIQLHVGPRFDAECASIGRTDLVGHSVAQVVPFDPLPLSNEDQYKFPLLCVYRKHEDYTMKSSTWYSIKSELEVLYILPPLTSDQGRKLYPLLTHVARVFVDRTMNGFDDGFNNSEQVWQEAGLDQIGMESTAYGKFPGLNDNAKNEKSNIFFPGISATLLCSERRMPALVNYSDFNGFDGYVSNTNTIDPANPISMVNVMEDL